VLPAVEGVVVPSSLSLQHNQAAHTLRLHYAGEVAAPEHVLGVVGFGAGRPAHLPAGCPFIAAPLAPVARGPAYEIWTAGSPVRHYQTGPVQGACSAGLTFGCVRLEEAGVTLEDAVERAYLTIFDFMEQTGFAEPIRFWNYLTAILGDDRGMERYRRFNIGRHRAFMARLHQAVPPAASGVGGLGGESVIYFLAARDPAQAIENPRQVSAYDYPQQYGPRSPSFSRAGRYGEALFISGTASIVGHETRHCSNLAAQLAETLENLRAVTGNAGMAAALADSSGWALKIYLRDPAFRARIEPGITAMFGTSCQLLYLHGEVCRPDLLIEIEAFYNP
jgi:chorismate lyase / 3-hydroxybenzoate synthase